MRLHVRLKGLELSASEQKLLQKRTARLEERLARIDPGLVDLEIVIERQARRREYLSQTRLIIMNRTLPAGRNRADEVRTLIVRVFEDIEEQLDQFLADLRGREESQRKRGLRAGRDLKRTSRRIAEEQALLARALAGDRTTFDQLAEARLAGVRKVIFEILSKGGREPTDDELDAALRLTLSRAYEMLARKPARWTMYGWLAHTARHVLKRSVRA